MTLPDSDLLYLREDERAAFKDIREHLSGEDWSWLFLGRLIDARKEIHRLQIAAGEVIEERVGDNPV